MEQVVVIVLAQVTKVMPALAERVGRGAYCAQVGGIAQGP